MYFEDIKLSMTTEIAPAPIPKEKMIAFAKDYDNIPLHTDEEYAKNSPFGKLIAPGVMSFMSVWAKYLEVDFFGKELLAGKSTKIEWLKPVFAEDTLTGKATVTNLVKRNAKNGLVEITIEAYNQHGVLVLTNVTEAIVKCKPTATAYFAGGCFWCITPFFKMNPGVLSVTSGYSGGDEPNPTYLEVKHQKTHHRETIEVVYAPTLVDYTELLDIFLSGVDPYDGEGQFIDRGFSYTLAVYYQTEEEKDAAKAMLTKLEAESKEKTFVALEPFKFFVPAEEEHQDYYLKHPEEFEQELIESGRKKK